MPFLTNHQILSSNNLLEMQVLLADLTNTDMIDVIGRGHEINASLSAAAFGGLNLLHVTYGEVPTQVRTQAHDEDTLLLFLLTGGAASVRHQGEEFDISTDTGLMRDMRAPLTATQDSFGSFVLPLPIEALQRHVLALLGEETRRLDIKFDARLDLTTPGGRHLLNTVLYIAETLDGPLRNLDNPLVLEGLKDLLLTSILTQLSNPYMELLQRRSAARIVPYYVKRARDYIHAHADTAITLEILAGHAGCGYRTLQVAFNDVYGMSPMNYVAFVRLNRARDDLRRSGGSLSVIDVAKKWGFTNAGRFAQKYFKQFGVMPSQTLRARK